MKLFFTVLTGLFLLGMNAQGQTYLTPAARNKAAYFFPEYRSVGAFDLNDSFLYICEGDTIRQVDLQSGEETSRFGKPSDYEGLTFASFLTIAPGGMSLWAGYTDLENADARVYRVDVETGTWVLKGRMPSNFDLAFWNDRILVSGLNSADFNAPNGIFLLDTSGSDNHRKIIETGGNSAGFAVDSGGDLFFGTSFFNDPNGLYRWDSASLATVIETAEEVPLRIPDAEKLTGLPMGVNDCEVDGSGNVIFSMNQWGATQVLAHWTGTAGEGPHYDTLALAAGDSDWLMMVKARGDITQPEIGNRIITMSFGLPLVDVHRADYLPFLSHPIPDVMVKENASDTVIGLSHLFDDPDDPAKSMVFNVHSVENEDLVSASVDGDQLTLSFTPLEHGTSEVVIGGVSGGKVVADTFQVIVEPATGRTAGNLRSLKIYPNPSTGIFTVGLEGVDVMHIEVITLAGVVVQEINRYTPGEPIDLGALPVGTYLLRATFQGRFISKLIHQY
jgi:hypothetical protein